MGLLTRAQLGQCFHAYAERLDRGSTDLTGDGRLFPFDVCPKIKHVQWRIPFVDQMVDGELCEMTNLLNRWGSMLRSWHAWLDVMDLYDEETAYGIQYDLVEPIALTCMFQPSAMRDRFTHIATNAFHQIRYSAEPDYPDRLIDDPPDGVKHPSRRKREDQLRRILSRWSFGRQLMEVFKALDGQEYRRRTKDFRNYYNHAIAPRFNSGWTKLVTRQVVPATVGNGRYRQVEMPGKFVVRYGHGGTPPLPMKEAYEANEAEFALAGQCFHEYVGMLNSALDELKPRQSSMD
jgi:hypothetical protein